MNVEDDTLDTLPEVPPRRRRRWLSIILSLVIFVCGFIVGAAVATGFIRNQILAAIRHPDLTPVTLAGLLRRPLGLSNDQVGQIEAIFRSHQKKLEDLRREVQPKVMAELDLVEQDVAKVLDSAQQEKWHRRFRELRQTWTPPDPPADDEKS